MSQLNCCSRRGHAADFRGSVGRAMMLQLNDLLPRDSLGSKCSCACEEAELLQSAARDPTRTIPTDFTASPLHCLVPCASSRDLTRLFFLRLSLSHADAAETLPRRRHWLPKGDAAPHGVRLPRDPHKAIQPASENSSGVTIRGGGNPSALSVSYRAGSKSAFAMCLQFHVNK